MRWHNRLEVVTLIGIVLGGRCLGVICFGGQLSLEEIGGNCTGSTYPGDNCVGIVRGAIVRGGQLSRGELSCSPFSQSSPVVASPFFKKVIKQLFRKNVNVNRLLMLVFSWRRKPTLGEIRRDENENYAQNNEALREK